MSAMEQRVDRQYAAAHYRYQTHSSLLEQLFSQRFEERGVNEPRHRNSPEPITCHGDIVLVKRK